MPETSALRWTGGDAPLLELIDQRVLPRKVDWKRYGPRSGAAGVAEAIRSMVVRGAPAIGIAAAYGMVLEAARHRRLTRSAARERLLQAIPVLAASRPTAVNLFWALERLRTVIAARPRDGMQLYKALERQARRMHTEDVAANRAMGRHGAALLPQGARVLTHCNAGALATAGYGTALGVIRAARGRISHVWVDETRPFLQGARLTAWELMQQRIPCTLITDSMAAHFMQRGEIDAVIVGADRVAANGDVANKIGTYGLGVLARAHRIPLYVACPVSTIDMGTRRGSDITIEERPAAEVTGFGRLQWSPPGMRAAHPAFDVTPAALVSALVTERGVISRPDRARIKALMSS